MKRTLWGICITETFSVGCLPDVINVHAWLHATTADDTAQLRGFV